MNDNELHYINVDAEQLWDTMVNAYADAGGDLLYPGDEKEALLRGVQAIGIMLLMKVDNGLRQSTLTYATRDFLKEYGLKRNCAYLEAVPAVAEVTVEMEQTGSARLLPAGTVLTVDGAVLWETTEDAAITGAAQTFTVPIRCLTAGETGNGLIAGTEMQFAEGLEGAVRAQVTTAASGGIDAEDEEAYRERIRTFGLASVTTGPVEQYRGVAMSVSSRILDAAPLNGGGGVVDVYLLTDSDEGTAELIAAVEDALNPDNVRPLNDHVNVDLATPRPYVLNVKYTARSGSSMEPAIAEAVQTYKAWQETTIGKAFDPQYLISLLYTAGCTRAYLDAGSEFDGGEAEYTEIEANEYCSGEINVEAIST